MTKDEKQILKSLAALFAFKAILYTSIAYTSRYYRKMIASS